MAAWRTAPVTLREPSRMTGIRVRWLAGVGIILGLVALGWLIFWIRDEFAVRASARAARQLIAAGQFQAAGEPLERWLKARPKSPECALPCRSRCLWARSLRAGFHRAPGGPQARLPSRSDRSRAGNRPLPAGATCRGGTHPPTDLSRPRRRQFSGSRSRRGAGQMLHRDLSASGRG